MSLKERFGTRDLAYSGWHRTLPARVTMIDLDGVEYCRRCRATLALIETALDVGQGHKTTAVTQHLAAASGVPAYCVLVAKDPNAEHGISHFRVRSVHPQQTPFEQYSKDQLATLLTGLHDLHDEWDCSAGRKRKETA